MKNECAEYVLRRQDGNHAAYSVRPAVRIDALTEKPPAMSLPESYKSGMSLRTRLGCTGQGFSCAMTVCARSFLLEDSLQLAAARKGLVDVSIRRGPLSRCA